MLKIDDARLLSLRCLGLSLSDQYQIRPTESDISWDAVNFFDHPFSDDIGEVLFGAKINAAAVNFRSTDNTSDGNLRKRWKIMGGKRCLIKVGSNPYRQQPFNEVIASEIMKRRCGGTLGKISPRHITNEVYFWG